MFGVCFKYANKELNTCFVCILPFNAFSHGKHNLSQRRLQRSPAFEREAQEALRRRHVTVKRGSDCFIMWKPLLHGIKAVAAGSVASPVT